jgi:C1A family cysteine protease
VTPIRNQGLCGSCWAFAAAAVYESYLAITKNQRYDLSEEYLLECTSLSNCQGGIVDYAFQKVTSGYGMPLESTFPYKAMNTFYGKPTTPGICTTNWKVFNTRYTVWNKYARITKANLQNVLASSPVAAMVYANTAFMNYKSGVFSCPSTSTSNNLLNHAIVIIGYDTSGNWIIKNSWGTNWGVAGYMYLKDSNDCGLKNFVYQFTERKVGSFGSSLIFTIVLLFVSLLAL